MWKKAIPYLIIGLALFAFYYWRYRTAPSLEISSLQLTNSQGETTSGIELAKDKSVIHFYASWCGPCIREMKEIKNNFDFLSSQNIRLILITDDNAEFIANMKKQLPAELEIYHIASLQEAGIYTLPTTYFLNENKITYKQVEAINWSDHDKIISFFTH